jgi:uncharacterized protein
MKGEPHELALGMAFGIFAGMMPILPFQIAVAVTLALIFKASKITAALGTWITNPLNWYFLYYYSYKLGAFIFRIPEEDKFFPTIMKAVEAVKAGGDPMILVNKMLGAGTLAVIVFLLGGLVMGIVSGIPSYFIFLPFFRKVRQWREARRRRKAQ